MSLSDMSLAEVLRMFAPLIAIQLGIQIWCITDLIRRRSVKGPKVMWAVIILIGQLLGPIAYVSIGRKDS